MEYCYLEDVWGVYVVGCCSIKLYGDCVCGDGVFWVEVVVVLFVGENWYDGWVYVLFCWVWDVEWFWGDGGVGEEGEGLVGEWDGEVVWFGSG